MKLHLISVGQRLPGWAETACSDYLKRFPRAQPILLHEIKAEPRTGNRTAPQIMEAEAVRIEAAVPAGARRVMLDERGADDEAGRVVRERRDRRKRLAKPLIVAEERVRPKREPVDADPLVLTKALASPP